MGDFITSELRRPGWSGTRSRTPAHIESHRLRCHVRLLRADAFAASSRNGRLRTPRLQSKSASSRLPPIDGADLEGRLRVDLARSPGRWRMAGVCAKRTARANVERFLQIAMVGIDRRRAQWHDRARGKGMARGAGCTIGAAGCRNAAGMKGMAVWAVAAGGGPAAVTRRSRARGRWRRRRQTNRLVLRAKRPGIDRPFAHPL